MSYWTPTNSAHVITLLKEKESTTQSRLHNTPDHIAEIKSTTLIQVNFSFLLIVEVMVKAILRVGFDAKKFTYMQNIWEYFQVSYN